MKILYQGPLIGKILNHLLELVLDDPTLNECETLIKLSADFIRDNPAPETK